MNFMSMGGAYAKEQAVMNAGMQNALAQPRTLREQLQDRIAGHQAQIDNLREALDALTPEVERALNALQKL